MLRLVGAVEIMPDTSSSKSFRPSIDNSGAAVRMIELRSVRKVIMI